MKAEQVPYSHSEKSPQWESLFLRLKDINATLKGFYYERDRSMTGKLIDEHRLLEEQLLAEKGEIFVDILQLRKNKKIPYQVPTYIIKDPNEILHPFSQNLIYIHLPVPEEPQKAITSKLKLPQLRKPGVIESTTDAIKLMGNYAVELEDNRYYLERSMTETNMVRDEEKRLRRFGGASESDRHYLNRLEAHLVIDRFIGLRRENRVPPGYDIGIGFLSAANLPGREGAHLVEVNIQTPDAIRTYTLLPPRAYKNNRPELKVKLENAINDIGGYDYYGYRVPRIW